MIQVQIQQERFDTGVLIAPLMALNAGAVVSFTGIARADENDAGAVTAIELEHYPAMTLAALQALAEQASERWELAGCVVLHRAGKIAVGEEIVLVAAASLHRRAALSATEFLIDTLKTCAPFWKKEYRSDGSAAWVDAKSSDDEAAGKWE